MKYAFTLLLVTIFTAILSAAALADEATVTGNGYMRPARSPNPVGWCEQLEDAFRCSMAPNTATWTLNFRDHRHKVYCVLLLKLVRPAGGFYEDRWDLWNAPTWIHKRDETYKHENCSIRWISGNHAIVQ